MVRDPQTGKYRRTRLFVLTLGYRRKAVRLLTFRSSSRIWAELHEKAFRRLGGSTRVVVLDNLREGVLVSDIYDPTLNPLYRDVLAHYGVIALPCRIKDPDRKGKVESRQSRENARIATRSSSFPAEPIAHALHSMDVSTSSGRLMFQIIGAMAEFERSLIQDRVRAGLRNAKLKGKTLGRPRRIVNGDEMTRLREQGASLREIAKAVGASPARSGRVCCADGVNQFFQHTEDAHTHRKFRRPS